jgi:hypothetical protein
MKYFIILSALLLFQNNIIAQFSEQIIINDDALSPWSIFATDLDGDGNIDVLSASTGDNTLAWYKNLDGLGNFGVKQVITQNLDQTRYVSANDIDGDGDMDVLATAPFADLVVWFENVDGLGNFGNQQIISSTIINPYKSIAVDVDSDEDLDIITAFPQSNKIAWFENTDGLGNFGTQQAITNNAINVFSVDFADINGDDIKDLICDSSSNGNGHPSWYANDGDGNFGPQQEITTDTNGSIYVIADDVDGDEDMDVLNIEFGGETIAWYENTNGFGNFGPKQIITNEVDAPFNIYMEDLDNDGDNDIIYNSQEVIDPDFLAWRANDGFGNFGEEQIISIDVIAPRGIFAADIDNDGDMDVLSSSIADNKIAWYKNLTIMSIVDIDNNLIKISPNPVNDSLIIENISNIDITSVKIYDILGRLVLQEFNHFNQINISNLDSGVLFVHIETDHGTLTKKVIKE